MTAASFCEFVSTRSSLPSPTRLRSLTPRSFSGAGGTIEGRLTRAAVPSMLGFSFPPPVLTSEPRRSRSSHPFLQPKKSWGKNVDSTVQCGMELSFLLHIKSVTTFYLNYLQHLNCCDSAFTCCKLVKWHPASKLPTQPLRRWISEWHICSNSKSNFTQAGFFREC